MDPVIVIALLSVLTGILAAIIYKYVGNQEAIKRSNNKIKAHILELRLYDYDPGLVGRAFADTMKSLFVYLGYTLRPILILIIPVIFILQQMHLQYSYEPLKPGDSSLVTVKLEEGTSVSLEDISLTASGGIEIESSPFYSAKDNEIDWNIRIREEGNGTVTFTMDGMEYTKKIISGETRARAVPTKSKGDILNRILNIGSSFLPKDGPVKSISAEYPQGSIEFIGIEFHWLVLFIIFSIIAGAVIMKIFGISW